MLHNESKLSILKSWCSVLAETLSDDGTKKYIEQKKKNTTRKLDDDNGFLRRSQVNMGILLVTVNVV